MKIRHKFIIFIVIVLASILLFPQTAEEKYCHQFSGESDVDKLSENLTICKTDLRCKVDQDNITTKKTDQNVILYTCIPKDDEVLPQNTSQKKPEFPE